MPQHDLVVIGASSGGVQALTTLVRGLPSSFPASVFIVLHVPPDMPSQLPAILNRVGRLPVAHAVDQEPIRRGRIYVAPPGNQTYVHRGRLAIQRGPAENLHRPAIDPLFRTAAHYYGPRVIGVILSGAMDDGSAGLRAVKDAGGITIVQAPGDAAFPEMPRNAMQSTKADYCVPVADLPELLVSLVTQQTVGRDASIEVPLETVEEAVSPAESYLSQELGRTSPFVCPDCNGTLWEIDDGDLVRYRCRVGHAYSQETMVKAQGEAVERALWTALRALEERVALMRRLADHARDRGHIGVAAMFDRRSHEADQDVRALHELIIAGPTLGPLAEEEELAVNPPR